MHVHGGGAKCLESLLRRVAVTVTAISLKQQVLKKRTYNNYVYKTREQQYSINWYH